MTARWHTPRHAAATPRTPYTFLRKSGRSDRSETGCQGPKARTRGLGEILSKQSLVARNRLERLERPEMQGNARAYSQPGSGGKERVHALLAISGRSGRSGRDPPSFPIVFSGLAFACYLKFRTLSEPFRTRQALPFTFEINILVSFHSKQQNLENRGQV